MDQVRRYQPPPNPAKVTDSRYIDYQREFGDESWELDALEPQVLAGLIQAEIDSLRDADKWEAQVGEERRERARLTEIADRWSEVQECLGGNEEEGDDA